MILFINPYEYNQITLEFDIWQQITDITHHGG
jgi:hypothetical protein